MSLAQINVHPTTTSKCLTLQTIYNVSVIIPTINCAFYIKALLTCICKSPVIKTPAENKNPQNYITFINKLTINEYTLGITLFFQYSLPT